MSPEVIALIVISALVLIMNVVAILFYIQYKKVSDEGSKMLYEHFNNYKSYSNYEFKKGEK